MTIARATLMESEKLNHKTLVSYLRARNPSAQEEFYAQDFVRMSYMMNVNWLGVFAIAYLMTDKDPFWVGIRTPGYEHSDGMLLRIQALCKEIRRAYVYEQHFADGAVILGDVRIDGADIQRVIDDVMDFAGVDRDPMPRPEPQPEPEPEPAPQPQPEPEPSRWKQVITQVRRLIGLLDSRPVWFALGFVLPPAIIAMLDRGFDILRMILDALLATF